MGMPRTSHLKHLVKSTSHDNFHSSRRLNCQLLLRLVGSQFPIALLPDQCLCHAMLPSKSQVYLAWCLSRDALGKGVEFLLHHQNVFLFVVMNLKSRENTNYETIIIMFITSISISLFHSPSLFFHVHLFYVKFYFHIRSFNLYIVY